MRKIFTLFAAMLLVSTMGFAQQRTTLWEGKTTFDSWGAAITNIDLSGVTLKAGDKIIVSAKADNTLNPTWEYGPQVHIKAGWNITLANVGLSDSQTEASCELSAENISDINTNGLYIQGINFVATKVEHLSSIERTSTNIWTGNREFGGWDDGFTVAAEKFATVKAGDVLEFIYTTAKADGVTYWQIKTIYNGTTSTLEGNAGDLNEWKTATVSETSTRYVIELTANDAQNLKEHGLFANGYYLIVTAVNLLQPKSTPVSSIKMERVNDGRRYNLNGQLVDENYRGLYIMNGRLHLNK